MNYRQATKKLRKLGCREVPRRRPGSHRIWQNPATGGFAPLPDWGSKDLKVGTLRGVVRLLGLDWKEFHRA